MKLGIIGGGAAGFFAAINAAEIHKNINITILEKTSNVLSKVKVSGGGRCNITNSEDNLNSFLENYPRGGKELRQVFSHFDKNDTVNWFETHNLPVKTENDGRVFPQSNSSQDVINLFLNLTKKYNITIQYNFPVTEITSENGGFSVQSGKTKLFFDKIIITTGGYNKGVQYSFIGKMGHNIIKPVPSLFTFNVKDEEVTKLTGISMDSVFIRISGTKINTSGSILFTHTGFSGPAILKLSALAARETADLDYNFDIDICWSKELIFYTLSSAALTHNYKQISNQSYGNIPLRLWQMLVNKSNIKGTKRWNQVSRKEFDVLSEIIYYDKYKVTGKNPFKEEFVTAGGVNRKEIDFKTMESKIIPGLYFAGEVIDIDGFTGGYNFQSAWSTAYIAAKSL